MMIRAAVFASLLLLPAIGQAGQGEKVLRVGIPAFPTLGINPPLLTNQPAIYTTAAIFDALTWVDSGGVAKPQAAESWEAVDANTLRFKLRPDQKFSNGEPVTAETVVFHVDLLKSPEAATYTVTSELPQLRSARVIDPLTVEITTSEPDPFLPQNMSLVRLMSPSHWRKVGAQGFEREPIGSGPFVITARTVARMALRASETTWRRAKVDRLELLANAEPVARLQALLSGNSDVAMSLGPDDTVEVEAAGHRMAVLPEPSTIVVGLITIKESPLRDVRVRRALNHAVDKERIVASVIHGNTRVATQAAPAIAFGFDPTIPPYDYDPALAKRLLAEAGYPDGFDMMMEIYTGTSGFSVLVYQQVAADLAKIGVRMEIRAIPTAKYAQGLHMGEWEGLAMGIDTNAAPSMDGLRPFLRHSCMWKVPWYCDEEDMPLLKEAMATFDLDRRRELTMRAHRRYRDMAASILLYDQVRFDAVASRVSGYNVSAGYVPYDLLDVTR